jgi:hypothetical protein
MLSYRNSTVYIARHLCTHTESENFALSRFTYIRLRSWCIYGNNVLVYIQGANTSIHTEAHHLYWQSCNGFSPWIDGQLHCWVFQCTAFIRSCWMNHTVYIRISGTELLFLGRHLINDSSLFSLRPGVYNCPTSGEKRERRVSCVQENFHMRSFLFILNFNSNSTN